MFTQSSKIFDAKSSPWLQPLCNLLQKKLKYNQDDISRIIENSKTIFSALTTVENRNKADESLSFANRAMSVALLSHYYYEKQQDFLKNKKALPPYLNCVKRLIDTLLNPDTFPSSDASTLGLINDEILGEAISKADKKLNQIIHIIQEMHSKNGAQLLSDLTATSRSASTRMSSPEQFSSPGLSAARDLSSPRSEVLESPTARAPQLERTNAEGLVRRDSSPTLDAAASESLGSPRTLRVSISEDASQAALQTPTTPHSPLPLEAEPALSRQTSRRSSAAVVSQALVSAQSELHTSPSELPASLAFEHKIPIADTSLDLRTATTIQDVYANLSMLYSIPIGTLIPSDDHYAILYDARAKQAALDAKSGNTKVEADTKIEVDTKATAGIKSVIQNELKISCDDDKAKAYCVSYKKLKMIFSDARANAIIQCSAYLDDAAKRGISTGMDALFFKIVYSIRNKLLYDHSASIKDIVDSICHLNRSKILLSSQKTQNAIFKLLMQNLQKQTTREAFVPNRHSTLMQICSMDPVLKNESLALYFRYLSSMPIQELNYAARTMIEADSCVEFKSLFPPRTGNVIVNLYSNPFEDKDRKTGALVDICRDIDSATQSIIIVSWAISFTESLGTTDEKSIAERLVEAAKRGVDVVILNWDSSLKHHQKILKETPAFIAAMADKHHVVDIEKRLIIKSSKRPYEWSDHQKLIIIDSKKLYTGGLNLTKFLGWHDCQIAVTGPCVTDALELTQARWLAAPEDHLLFPGEKDKRAANIHAHIILASAKILAEQNALVVVDPRDTKDAASDRKLDAKAIPTLQFLCTLSKDAWGLPSQRWRRTEDTTSELQDAHIAAIRSAERFIYMENQYFIGPRENRANSPNQVIATILAKIIQCHQQKKPFHFYCQLPLIPNGDPNSDMVQTLLRKTWNTMKWFIDEINKATGNQSREYVTFYHLHNEYTHAKLLIVDDKHLLIGSPNCSERSMVGGRDSEDVLYMVGPCEVIFNHRAKLMIKHFGCANLSKSELEHIENQEVVRALRKQLDGNLPFFLSNRPVDSDRFGNAVAWGLITPNALSLGHKPDHIPDQSPFLVRVAAFVSDRADSALH